MAQKTFKTRKELTKFLSAKTFSKVDVNGLTVVYDEIVEPAETEQDEDIMEEEALRKQYEEKHGKTVPNNMKNNTEWIKKQL